MRLLPATTIALLLAGAVGCADEFADYNQIEGFRLLGVGADAPALTQGDSATVSALVSEPADSYSWSWCPLTQGTAGAYECAVSEAELQAQADAAFGEGQVEIPPYDLGSGETATFDYTIPAALLQGICDFIRSEDVPDIAELPSCMGIYEVSIRLEVSGGGKQVIAVRDLDLIYDDSIEPNTNPAIGGVFATAPGGSEIELAADSATQLQRDVLYDLRLDIGADQAETYVAPPLGGGEPESQRESLYVTWFYQAGGMDRTRTSFLQDDADPSDLVANIFRAPTSDELAANSTRLYFVIRDNRGGLTWQTREIELVTP